MPERIQRKRTKGWRMPPNTVYVGRGSLLGNPFVVGQPSGYGFADGGDQTPLIATLTLEQSISLYRDMVHGILTPEMHPHGHEWMKKFMARTGNAHPLEWIRRYLRGSNVACWCPPPKPGDPDICHAAVLLKIANSDEGRF